MFIHQVAAEAHAVADPARSLFGSPEPLTAAGELVDRHSDFAAEQAPELSHDGPTDTTLKPVPDYRFADKHSRSADATKGMPEATQTP